MPGYGFSFLSIRIERNVHKEYLSGSLGDGASSNCPIGKGPEF